MDLKYECTKQHCGEFEHSNEKPKRTRLKRAIFDRKYIEINLCGEKHAFFTVKGVAWLGKEKNNLFDKYIFDLGQHTITKFL